MHVIPSPSHYSTCDVLSSREAPQRPSTQGLCSAGHRHSLPGMHQAADSQGKAGLSINHILVQVVQAQGTTLTSSGNSEDPPEITVP